KNGIFTHPHKVRKIAHKGEHYSVVVTTHNKEARLATNGHSQIPAMERILANAIESGMGLDDLESRVYAAALAKTKGNVSAAARLLKISRAQLDYRIVKGRINRSLW